MKQVQPPFYYQGGSFANSPNGYTFGVAVRVGYFVAYYTLITERLGRHPVPDPKSY